MVKNKLNNPYQSLLIVEAQATYYPEMISVYIPKQPIVKHEAGFEKPTRANKNRLEDDAEATPSEDNAERALRRTRKQIRDYVLCNRFDMFCTFTFADDRENIDQKMQQMLGWLKNQRNRNGKFRYLVVPEFHKDGKALHFHALFGDYAGRIEKAINPKTGAHLKQGGRLVYKFTGYTLGFNNVKLIGSKNEDSSKVASYVQKYITKDMPSFYGRQRYWATKGLLLPFVEDNPEPWYKHATPDWSKELENGTVMRFNIGKNALVDMFWEVVK